MKKVFLPIFFLTFGVVNAGNSDNDIKVWIQWHKDMFSEMAQDFDPHKAYTIPVLPNQNPSPSRHKAATSKKEVEAPVHFEPITTKYHADTAWGSLDATVVDSHDNYVIKVNSSNPAQKWILKTLPSQEVLQEGGVNEQQSFIVRMNRAFQNNLALTVMIEADGQVYPALLPLTNGK